MRTLILISIVFIGFVSPVLAQHTQPRGDASGSKVDIISDEKALEVKQLIAKAKERQKAVDRHNSGLWDRWVYADCLGCGRVPKNVRIMHTNPSRVLIGIPAAEDDAREPTTYASRSEPDIEPLPAYEVKQRRSARREHVASASPR